MSYRKNPKCEFCGDPAYMNDNGTWKCKPRIESQITKKNAEAYCQANGLVMVPEVPSMEMIVAGNDAMGDCGSSFAYKAMVAAYKEQAF